VANVLSPKGSAGIYEGLRAYLERALGRPVVLVQRATYAETNDLIRSGEADVAAPRIKFAFTDPVSNSGRFAPTYQLLQSGERPDTFFSRYIFTYATTGPSRRSPRNWWTAGAVLTRQPGVSRPPQRACGSSGTKMDSSLSAGLGPPALKFFEGLNQIR